MTKRLVKIAKELNVGTTTIVDYLNNHGFDIENKPTAKITNEMYNELLKEFQKSIAIKEEASKLVIGNRPSGKGGESDPSNGAIEQPVPENNSNENSVPAETEPEDNNTIENKNSEPIESENHSSPTTEVLEKSRENANQPKLKVIGKIDLESRLRSKAEKKQRSKAKKEPKKYNKGKSNPAQNKEPKEEVPTPPTEKTDLPKPEAQNKENPAENPAPKADQKSPQPEVPAKKAPKQTGENGNATDQANQNKTDEPDANGEGQSGVVRIEAPELRGLKIQGKIDIDKFKRPSKKRKDKDKDNAGKEKKGGDNKENNRGERSNNEDRPKRVERERNRSPRGNDRGGDRRGNRNDRGGDRPQRGEGGRSDRPDRNERSRTANSGGGGGRDRNDRPGDRRPQDNRNRPAGDGNRGGGNRSDDRGGSRRPPARQERQRELFSGDKKPNNSSSNSKNSADSGNDDSKRRRRTRKKVTVDNQNRSKDGGRSPRRKDAPQRDEVKEVSQKEIEEKIKATMAKISGRGKKKRQRLQRDKRDRMREKQELKDQEAQNDKLQLTEFVSVQELANLMDVPVTDVIMTCMNLGVIVSINQRLDAEIIELVASEFDHEVEFITAEEEVDEEVEEVDDPADLEPRAPIVTVMGHVDHGKTSLLDYIREATVASGEAGGITQHIGAYEVYIGEEEEEEKKKITFLDTPGHEAFTAMRARGAKVTDIAIIVIAADDSIMPQTKEAISHAQAAGVPIVFAINKIDKPGAQPERIKQELAGMNLLVEEWGGAIQSQDISAKTGENVDLLLEKVLLEAELLELQANPDKTAVGTVVEASLEKGRGYVTKMLVQAGTLKIGASIVAGEVSGKVRAMLNERGKRVKVAGPSTPVLILGLDGAPQAGERFKQVDSDQEARQIASRRAQIAREQANRATKRISLDEIGRRLALGSFKELNLIIKGDVDGSVEALSDSLIKQSIETVQVNVIHKAVGQIIESDVLLASASDAIIIGFQVRPSLKARNLAEREGVEIKTYSIIYEAIEQLKLAIEGMLEPDREEQMRAMVEVREVYKISKVGTVAGCYVQEGKINRNHHIRLIRDGIVIYPTKEGVHGELASLKRFKDDVKEVASGFECGMTIKNYNDIKLGDNIEAYEIVEIKRKL